MEETVTGYFLDLEDAPFKELGDNMPENLYYLTDGKLVLCYEHNALHGMAVFSTAARARVFMELRAEPGTPCLVPTEATFEEACDIAKTKPHLTCLLLLDNVSDPVVHYIR